MRLPILLLAGALVLPLSLSQSAAAAGRHCLTRPQQRAAIVAGKAVRLAHAIRQAKRRFGGDVVRARLCHSAAGLVYLLTVLRRDGRVMRVTIHAGSGRVIGAR